MHTDTSEAPDPVETHGDEHEFSEAGDPPAEDDAEGGDDAQPDGEEGEGEPVEPDEGPAIDAPKFWDADDKAAFANLPRAEQERIAKYAAKGDAATSKAIQEASEQRKAAEAVKAEAEAKRNELSSVVEQAAHKFVRQWDGIDWATWYQQDFQNATIARAQYEQEQEAMKTLLFKKQEADKHATESYVKSEAQALYKLAEVDQIAADLLDAKEGHARRTEVATYLVDQGIDPDRLSMISAKEMSMARKAMLYDRVTAKVKDEAGKPAPKSPQPSPPGKAPMRSAARPAVAPQPASVQAASERFQASGSVDDAVALLNARDRNKRNK